MTPVGAVTRHLAARAALAAVLACALAGTTGCAALQMLGEMAPMFRPQAGSAGSDVWRAAGGCRGEGDAGRGAGGGGVRPAAPG